MEVAHHLADDLGALPVRLVVRQPHFVHAEKNAAVHRFQPVSNIRQRASNDDAHRVINVRPLHFVFDVDGSLMEGESVVIYVLVCWGAALLSTDSMGSYR